MRVAATRGGDADWTGEDKMGSCQLGEATCAPGSTAYRIGLRLKVSSYVGLAVACIVSTILLRGLRQQLMLFGGERDAARGFAHVP